jgi:hypothetical protein
VSLAPEPSPLFFVSVADKGVSIGVSGVALIRSIRVEGRVGLNAEFAEFAEEEGIPHPRCFLSEWQAKDLGVAKLLRVADTGLKVVGFSASCEVPVRVAGKGVWRKWRVAGDEWLE